MKEKFRRENFNYGLFPPQIKLYHRNASIENESTLKRPVNSGPVV